MTTEGERLEKSGNLQQALDWYVLSGAWDQAARVALSLNRVKEAGTYSLQANRPYDAAVCFQKAGALQECLEALKLVPAGSARYRAACVHMIRVAQLLERPLVSLSSLLVPFISARPQSPQEASAFNALADAYSTTDKARLAASLYRTVLAAFPDDAEARSGLSELQKAAPAEPVPGGGPRPATPAPAPAPPQTRAPTPAPSSASGARLAPASGMHRALARPRFPKLGELLVAEGTLTVAEVERLVKDKPDSGKSDVALADALAAEGAVAPEVCTRLLATHAGMPFLTDQELFEKAPTAIEVRGLGHEQAEQWRVVPLSATDRQLCVAMRDPRDITLIDKLRFATRLQVTGVFATEKGLEQAIRKVYLGEVESADQWRGKVWDQETFQGGLQPFSDRVTGTRERQYDTGDLEKRLEDEAERLGSGATSGPVVPRRKTQDMPALPAVGSTFAGRYQIEALIGQGGSAAVFRALDTELNEAIALKMFHPTSAAEAESLVARFKLELSLSRRLSHPNIIRLYDLGADSGFRYLTMELLEGADLSTFQTTLGGRVPMVEGLRYLEQVCVGLQAAHEREVIHRDIKPENIFITRDGVAKLMDFGIAKNLRTPGVTMAGMIVGTPEFMSPEQTSGFANVTSAADLYSLGATAYAMFAGRPPFTHPDLVALLVAHATQAPAPLRTHDPAVDLELEAVVLKALEKKPEQRFASAREMGERFAAIRERLEAGG